MVRQNVENWVAEGQLFGTDKAYQFFQEENVICVITKAFLYKSVEVHTPAREYGITA